MRENKKLQRLADESLEQYNNREFLEKMKNKISENVSKTQKAKVKRRRLFFTAFATALSAILIVWSVFLFLPQKSTVIEEKHYTIDHKETEIIDLDTLNAALTEIYLDNRDYEDIKKYYDSYYNDVLYYETELVLSEFENVLIDIVVNNDYEYAIKYTCDKTDIVYDYALNYLETFIGVGGLYQCKVYGYMDTGTEKIYFTYNAYTFDQSSNFIDLVKELIKKK